MRCRDCNACFRCFEKGECTEKCKRDRTDNYNHARNQFAGDPSKPLAQRDSGKLKDLAKDHLLIALQRSYPLMEWEDVPMIIARTDVAEGPRVQLRSFELSIYCF